MSISSSTDIGNLALDLLSAGTVQNIESPTSPTEELLNRWYDHSRKKVLRSHPWNCATKRIQLAASAVDPVFGYDKQFELPADFLRVLTVNDSTYTVDAPAPNKFFRVENNKILTSNLFGESGILNLVYIFDLTDISIMDALLIDLIAHEIAIGIAYKVTDGNASVQRISELRKEARSLAQAIDGQESPPTVIERSRSRHVRRAMRSGTDSHRIIF